MIVYGTPKIKITPEHIALCDKYFSKKQPRKLKKMLKEKAKRLQAMVDKAYEKYTPIINEKPINTNYEKMEIKADETSSGATATRKANG